MEIGPGVKHVKPGDKVVLHWRKGLGIEGTPPNYSWRGQKLNAGWITTFNEYAIVAENRVTMIPSDSDMEVAALFGCAVTTGFGVVECVKLWAEKKNINLIFSCESISDSFLISPTL